jgi:uncharacterized membrane protein
LRNELPGGVAVSIVAAAGATSLGAVIGWLVRYFIRRLNRFGPVVLGSVVSVILGGAVIKFLEADRSVWWFYPIGLAVGLVVYHFAALSAGVPKEGKGPTWKLPDKSNPWYMRKRR